MNAISSSPALRSTKEYPVYPLEMTAGMAGDSEEMGTEKQQSH